VARVAQTEDVTELVGDHQHRVLETVARRVDVDELGSPTLETELGEAVAEALVDRDLRVQLAQDHDVGARARDGHEMDVRATVIPGRDRKLRRRIGSSLSLDQRS
jgi:hypothetical protein